MKTITLQRVKIANFKGIHDLEAEFGKRTAITGGNGTGKSSVQDAFNWCLFGTNAAGSSIFKVQPLDANNNVIHKLTTEVELTLTIDGQSMTLKRQLNENWSTPKGTATEVLRGTETTYFANDVPCKQSEYRDKIDAICPMADLRLITSTTAFNAQSTQEKRQKLQQIAGTVSDADVAKDFINVKQALEHGKTIEEFRREIASKKGKSKTLLEQIPSRIDQQEKLRPQGIDFKVLDAQAAQIVQQIGAIDAKLQKSADANKALFDAQRDNQRAYNELQQELGEIELSFTKELAANYCSLENTKEDATQTINRNERQIKLLGDDIANMNGEREKLRELVGAAKSEWLTVNSKIFNPDTTPRCPTCKKPYTADELAGMEFSAIERFNTSKLEQLTAIEDKATTATSSIKALDACIAESKITHAELTTANTALGEKVAKTVDLIAKRPTVEQLKGASKEYAALTEKASKLFVAIRSAAPQDENAEVLKQAKAELQQQLKAIEADVAKKELIAKIDTLRAELDAEAKTLAQAVADMERIEFEILQFQKRKIEMVEATVSSLFSIVKWKMYEPNITNDGQKEICECVVDGVPYNDNLNTASRVNAGIDICNALTKAVGVCAPIFVDNKESVTDLIDTPSQLITLEVIKGQKLTINQ